jgi:hypothetical protein
MVKETYTCTSCNTPISEDAKFCPNCGEKFTGFEDNNITDSTDEIEMQETNNPFWKKPWVWAATALTLILIVVIFSFLGKAQVKYIGNFDALINNGKVEARFSLMDDSKKPIAGEGIADARVVNKEGETIYTGETKITADKFQTYTLRLTGKDFLAYAWEIPLENIKKSPSQEGTMYLKFHTNNEEFAELNTSIYGLPTYSEDELADINTKNFSKTAIPVNASLSKGNFTVTIKQAGSFNPLSTYDDKKEYFRVDMDVKNTGGKNDYFMPNGLSLIDDRNRQYERDYGGSLDSISDINSRVTKSGYFLFKQIPDDVKQIKLVFELGNDANFNPHKFEFPIALTK